jgi:hypothetical protein
MAMEGFQQQIIEIFKRVKTENSGLRFDHMLELVRDELRKSTIPRGLSLSTTFIDRLTVEEMKRTGNTSSGYSLSAPATESEWVQYTSAQYEHNYDFTDETGGQNHGIWIVDSSYIHLSQMKPKDIYCSYTKFQGKPWQTGESILNGSEMYFGGQQPTQKRIKISELARRLAEKYLVANVNFIDLSCRSLDPSNFEHLSDLAPDASLTWYADPMTAQEVPVAHRSDFTQGQQGQQASQAPYKGLFGAQNQVPVAYRSDFPFTPEKLASYQTIDQLILDNRDIISDEQLVKAIEAWKRLHSRGGRFKKSRRQNSNRQNSNRQNSKKQNKKKW